MSSPQYLLDAVMAQRDSAMNSLAQTVAQLRDKDDELAKKDGKQKEINQRCGINSLFHKSFLRLALPNLVTN